jgi:hypothetical protein
MYTADPPVLLDAFKAHRAKLTVEAVGLRKRIASLDQTIANAERLLDQHDISPGRTA